ncbi:MAG: hypothetical protein A3H95_16055 [Acidobacteria bacterium RIFCSPLOWO2_02_FULL_64_15]|nr:MAG: hypothetical protein A3H95_16055 [Acidobacteria bacterium RIFCSPLOWO2_02_FULL_64_15]
MARILTNQLTLWPGLTTRHRFVLYFDQGVPPDEFLRHSAFEHRVVPRPAPFRGSSLLREQLLLPLQVHRDDIDLFYAPWYYGPLYSPAPKTVVGVWDISYTTHRHHYPLKEGLRLSLFSRYSCGYAAGVLTCSPYDKRQIERYYGVPSERVCALPLAPNPKFMKVNEPARLDALRRKYGLPAKYILSLGVIMNRRHVDVIIDAFSLISAEYRDVGLMVVGRNYTVPAVDIEARMRPLVEAGQGAYLPFAPEEEMVDLYNGAWCYVCVSTVDGEATMLKEAMRCGTPVVTSPMLEEAVDGIAVVAEDPTNPDAMAKAFRRMIVDVELHERLASQGLEWSASLSWGRVAEMSLEFLESR